MNQDNPWVRVEHDSNGHPYIKGNADGLRHLRHKIDEAVVSKHAPMKEFDCNLSHIEISNEYPPEQKQGCMFRIAMIILLVTLILGLAALAMLLMGAFTGIPDLFSK
jgi:hypothetical protein